MLGSVLSLVGCGNEQGFSPIVEDPEAPEPIYYTDEFTQNDFEPKDALFVIDDSGSMRAEQATLVKNLPYFFHYFDDLKIPYHIGVVTTDMEAPEKMGQLQPAYGFPYLTPDTQGEIDAQGLTDDVGLPLTTEDVFKTMTTVGTNGAGSEKGMDAISYAMNAWREPGEANEGFWRDEADVQVVVVSDEEDYSVETTVEDLTSDFLALQQVKDARVHSIVAFPDDTCESDPGDLYLALSAAVGGESLSICSNDWDDMLDNLGLEALGLSREFYLTYTPDVDTITVEVNCTDPETGEPKAPYHPEIGEDEYFALEYKPETNSVRFRDNEDIPAPGCTMDVSYWLKYIYEYEEGGS